MKKLVFSNYVLLVFLFGLFFTKQADAQTASTTITYSGFQSCGGCTVCGADYYCFNTISSWCGNTTACNTKTFTDPVPPGNIVTSVTVNYFSAQCSGGSLAASINGNSVPAVNEANSGCPCSNNPCGQSATSSSNFPCGLPGYINGGVNSLQLCTGANVCINRLVLVLTYAPANQATPATQPANISGSSVVCPGATVTYSCPVVSNAANYNWTVPAGWTITSGQGTNVMTATAGSAGNVCVRAENLCGNSVYTCFGVTLNTVSSPATSISASPPAVCAGGASTLNSSGGSLGTGATWNWYTGSCGGTLVGTGSSISVTPSSTTTYYVAAVGTCNTTACLSVAVTVNPAPTANAGSPAVITCGSPNVVLGGSGGTSYTWSGPGIVSGGNTATPTVNQPGTYSLVVTSAGCNSAISTVAVTQNTTAPSASASAGSGGVLTCNITSLSLSGSPASGVTYSWTGPGIVSGNNTPNPVVNAPGTYSLIATSTSNGCSSPSNGATVSVTQNITPPSASAAAAAGSVLDCNVTSLGLSGSPSSGVTYSWSGPGIVSGGTTATPTVNQPGTYSLVATNSSNGCSNPSNSATVVITQNVNPPAAAASTSSSITCTSQTVSLSSTPAGLTYTWTAPSGSSLTSGTNAQTASANGGGTYTVTIKNMANGCSANALVTIPQNTAAPTGVSAAAGGTITCGSPTTTLSCTPSSGVTYSWSGPGIVSGGNTANPVVNQAGNYSLTVTSNSNGCSNSSSPAIATVTQNGAVPTATVAPTGSLTCSSTSLTLNGSSSANTTYTWTGPGIISGSSTSTVNINQPGSYTYMVTNNVSGCTNSITVSVPQNTTTPSSAVVSTGNGTLTCLVSSVTLTVSPASGLNYSWSGPGIVSGGSSANPVVNAPGTYTVIATDPSNGCSNSASPGIVSVTQNTAAPVVTASTASGSGSLTCAVSSVTLNTSPAGSNYSYSWSGPGIVSGSNTATPEVNVSGNYSVTVTNTVTGCSSATGSAGSVVFVPQDITPPVASINATTTGSITCTHSVVTIDATASSSGPNITYSWSDASGPIPNSNTSALPTANAGSYTLTVFNATNGCSSTGTITIGGNASVPTGVSAGTSPGLPCDGSAISLSGTSTSGNVSYSWAGPGAYNFSGQNATGITAPGIYTLTVTDNTTGCSVTDTVIVNGQAVHASFTSDKTSGIAPLVVTFSNTSTGGTTYSWNFGDGNSASTFNASNTFGSGGSYTVILTVDNGSGCTDTAMAVIVVEDGLFLEIPNVFTPNGDGVNDLFVIKSTGIREISLEIFNRWGEKMYEFSGAKAAWDGVSQKGMKVPDATYFYFVKATGFDDKTIEKNGTVTLFH